MIDFYREPDVTEYCPHCRGLLVLNPEFPDLVVWTCPTCHRSFSPTDLNKCIPKPPFEGLAMFLIFVGWPAFLFLVYFFLLWIF